MSAEDDYIKYIRMGIKMADYLRGMAKDPSWPPEVQRAFEYAASTFGPKEDAADYWKTRCQEAESFIKLLTSSIRGDGSSRTTYEADPQWDRRVDLGRKVGPWVREHNWTYESDTGWMPPPGFGERISDVGVCADVDELIRIGAEGKSRPATCEKPKGHKGLHRDGMVSWGEPG